MQTLSLKAAIEATSHTEEPNEVGLTIESKGLFEIFRINRAVRALVLRKSHALDLAALARKFGVVILDSINDPSTSKTKYHERRVENSSRKNHAIFWHHDLRTLHPQPWQQTEDLTTLYATGKEHSVPTYCAETRRVLVQLGALHDSARNIWSHHIHEMLDQILASVADLAKAAMLDDDKLKRFERSSAYINRYMNPGKLEPENRTSCPYVRYLFDESAKQLRESGSLIEIDWKPKRLAVLCDRKVLHARPPLDTTNSESELSFGDKSAVTQILI